MNNTGGKPSIEDSRRLTGANLFWDWPSAILEVNVATDQEAWIASWSAAARKLLHQAGHGNQALAHRLFTGGASLLISAPIDALYSMCELNEVAWAMALAGNGIRPAVDEPAEVQRLQSLFREEERPRLLRIQQQAASQGVPFLWDDDEVSLGYGETAEAWPYAATPDPETLDWTRYSGIPLALVTGTNGKSTTVRMLAAIFTAAGWRGGLTSTDFIRVGDETIETGDYSGTGGARTLLRHPQVQAAALEVARGGLLRRGLGVERANAAVITNVAEDHLGEYGIQTLEELIQAKFIVARGLRGASPLILNADDDGIVAHSRTLDQPIWWFSVNAGNPLIAESLKNKSGAGWLDQGQLWIATGPGGIAREPRSLMPTTDIPATLNGRVLHNVQNALAAALAASTLGVVDSAICKGLATFRGDEQDNPGRGNWFEHAGVRIVVDFAHNEHGLRALAQAVNAMQPERIAVMIGQAGDRTDELIRNLTRAACLMSPDRLLITDLPGDERGRKLSDVPDLIDAEARAIGIPAGNISRHGEPVEAVKSALRHARTGDVLVFLALTQRQQILELVHQFIDGELIDG